MTTKKCGDCIHAEICKKVNSGWFSPKNIAYCTAFKERKNCVEVVRCKDCKCLHIKTFATSQFCSLSGIPVEDDDFCSYGERKDNGNET